jgi:hypothetical protein
MIPWMPMAWVGTRVSEVHFGQVGQPRPEEVSRTAAPVTTSTTPITRAERQAQRTAFAEGWSRSAR